MSTEQSSKNLGMGILYVSINAGTNIAIALRRTLNAIMYANVKYGEDHYIDYLKKRGYEFKKDINLAKVAFDKKKSDIERVSVNQEDVRIIKEYSMKYGMDFALTKRPKDLDTLIDRYIKKEKLTSQEEKIIKAFTIRDHDGNLVMDPEKPGRPQIRDAQYMLTFASVDLARWELICREMEARSHIPPFEERMKSAIQLAKINLVHVQNKVRERFKERGKDRAL